jgi:hypothetical protein
MTDEKKKGKALNALKKKFNTGGRVNARRGGRRAAEDELGVAVKKPTGFQQMGEVIQTPEPKKPTETFKTSVPKTATQAYEELKGDPIGKAGLQQKLAPLTAEQAAIMGTQSPRVAANVQQAQAVTAQSPRGAANFQQAQNAGQAVMAQSAGAGTDFNIDVDVDLSGMPQRGDYGKGKEGNDAYQAALKAWQASLGDTGSSGGGGGDSGGGSNTPPTSEELDEKKEELKQTQENYVAPKAEVVKAGQAIDHDAIIQDAMNRQPLFSGEKKMDYSYDAATGEYVIDNAGWGFEGDARFRRMSPEEFYDKMGINPNKFMGDDPSLSTSEEDIQKLKTGEDRVGIDDPTDVTAGTTSVEQGTAAQAKPALGFDSKNVARAFAEKTGLKYKIDSDGNIKFQDGAGRTFTRKPEDLVDEFKLEGDFGTSLKAKTITADAISDEDRTRAEAATAGTFDDSANAGVATLTQGAEAVGRDAEQERAAMAKAATRPEKRNYADGATSENVVTVGNVTGPTVEKRDGITISDEERARLSAIAQGRGVDLEELDEYQDTVKTKQREAQSGEAAAGTYTSRLGETSEATAARAKYFGADYTPQGGKTEIDDIPAYAKAATRVAQVGVAAKRIASELGTAPSVDFKGREAITGTAPQGDASQIGGIPTFEAASRNAVTGKERTVAAADMMAVVADIPEDVTAAISEDPATVEAQIDSGADPQVTAAVAALPQEALVSVQMENLLAGMEEGKTPAWARPAVAAIEQQMAQRGLSASTVGRDALFNAIIQSALPMAQSNAQALQQRAQQNLSNQQQANLASAQNTMTVRMQNLANRQTAASQTASMAQEIKVQQGSFSQQATITTAQQKQQTEIATFQAAQQRAQQESAQRQQAAIAELSTNAQMDLANLQALNAAGAENMSAEQQGRLTKYNAQIAKVMRQADLKQDMEKANLNSSLQLELANLSEMNAAAKDTMTAENQEKLTNLQTLVDFRKTDAQFAQQMDMANMSNEQQMELAMLQDRAATDSANFTADNQFRMQELNQKVARSVRQAELNQRMEEVNLDSKLKIELSELV